MEPTSIPTSIDDLLKLGQVPVGVATLWILYQIMSTLKVAITKMDTVLETLTKVTLERK